MDENVEKIKSCIADYPDFPKPGILFKDVMPLMRNPSILTLVIDIFCQRITTEFLDKNIKVNGIIGIESRGFFFGPLMSVRLNIPFIAARKPGKLPGSCVTQSYSLEYGTDSIQVQTDAIQEQGNYVIVDDLLATGGTMAACAQLVKSAKGIVLTCFVVIELTELQGRAKISAPVSSIVQA